MRDCLMMRDMARAYEGLIMTNIEKARATGDQNKIKEAEEAVDCEMKHKAEDDMFMSQMADAYRD